MDGWDEEDWVSHHHAHKTLLPCQDWRLSISIPLHMCTASIAPVWLEFSKSVQEGPAVVRQQRGQHAPVRPGVEVLGVARVAAVDGGQADVEVAQQDHSAPSLPQRADACQQSLRNTPLYAGPA